MLNNNNFTISTRYTPPTIPYRSQYQNRYSSSTTTRFSNTNNKTPRISNSYNNNNNTSSNYYNRSRNYQNPSDTPIKTDITSSSLTNTPSKRHRYDSDNGDSYYHNTHHRSSSRDNRRSLSSHSRSYNNNNNNSDNSDNNSDNHRHYHGDYRNNYYYKRDSYKRSRSPNYSNNKGEETPFKRSKSEKEDGEI